MRKIFLRSCAGFNYLKVVDKNELQRVKYLLVADKGGDFGVGLHLGDFIWCWQRWAIAFYFNQA